MSAYVDGTKIYIFAHRGGGEGRYPENSLAAFTHANDIGIRYLETDVRLGSDKRIYLSHGATSVLPNQHLNPHGRSLVTLEELFDKFPSSYFSIDPKHALVIKPLADVIVRKGMVHRVCIGASFDSRAKRIADLIEQKSGTRPATALVSANANLRLLLQSRHFPLREQQHQAAFIHVHRKLISPSIITAAHKQNLKIIAWVINDKPTMRTFLQWGVDGFMTDVPSVAIEVVDHL